MAQAMVFCDICNIGVSSEVTMRDHVKGRRHQQALGAVERRKSLARNSLYCHGFPPAMPSADIRNYFQRFGTVTRIVVETQRGCYCIVQYDNEVPVQKALGQRNHQLCGCSLTVRPRKPITPYRRPTEADRNQRKAKAAKEEEEQAEASHEQMMSSLLQADSVLSQMEILYDTMRLSDPDLDRRKRVCDYLQSILIPFLPTCSIHQFGSSVNGFGMKGCDMDIFLDLRDTGVSLQWEETLRQKYKPVNLPYIREMQVLKTTEGPLMPSQLRQLSLVHRVKLVSRILMQHAHNCTEVLFVPSVRCPIVRFQHSPTGIKCDLSINNRLALRNTQLLQMCGTDLRVRLLIFAVRYWGKWKQVAGNQNCGPRLSNYCLSLLVIFFLANTSPPFLPSVQALADMTDPKKRCIIEEWDCSLPEAIPETTNNQPADELLQQFFQFYHKLSLSSTVLLTRQGTAMSLSDFLLEKVNSPHLNDFKVKALAVQDPFVLCHNIAQNMNHQLRDLLLLEIENAVNKTVTWAPADCSLSDAQTSQSLWGLPYLISAEGCKRPEELGTDTPSSSSSSISAWCVPISRDPNVSPKWICSLALDLSLASQSALSALQAEGDYRAVWFRRVRTMLVWVLKEVFVFSVKTEKDGAALEDEDLDGDDGEDEVEEMCVEDEGKGGEGSLGEETRAGIDDGTSDVRCTEPAVAARETAMTGTCDMDGPAMTEFPGACEPKEAEWEILCPNTDTVRSDSSSAADSEMQSSPLALSELAHVSPVSSSCEGKEPLELPNPTTSQQQSDFDKRLQDFASVPLVMLTQVSCLPEKMSSSHKSSPSCTKNVPNNMLTTTGDVEMKLDSSAALLAPNEVDSSATEATTVDLLNCCSEGETGSGTSVLPLRVEFNPAEGHQVFVSSDKGASSCSLEGSPQTNLSESTDVLNVMHISTHGSLESSSAVCGTAASVVSSEQKTKKCRPLRIYCEGKIKAWYGRKAIRTILLSEGYADDLELEKLISKRIADRDSGSSLLTLQFYCTLVPIAKTDQAEAEIWFQPEQPAPKEFSVFTTFFKSFFTKLISKKLLAPAAT